MVPALYVIKTNHRIYIFWICISIGPISVFIQIWCAVFSWNLFLVVCSVQSFISGNETKLLGVGLEVGKWGRSWANMDCQHENRCRPGSSQTVPHHCCLTLHSIRPTGQTSAGEIYSSSTNTTTTGTLLLLLILIMTWPSRSQDCSFLELGPPLMVFSSRWHLQLYFSPPRSTMNFHT